jgi:hypothetical protein
MPTKSVVVAPMSASHPPNLGVDSPDQRGPLTKSQSECPTSREEGVPNNEFSASLDLAGSQFTQSMDDNVGVPRSSGSTSMRATFKINFLEDECPTLSNPAVVTGTIPTLINLECAFAEKMNKVTIIVSLFTCTAHY